MKNSMWYVYKYILGIFFLTDSTKFMCELNSISREYIYLCKMSFLCNNDEQKNLYLLLKKVNFWTLYTKSFWWRKLFHNSNNNNNRHINLFRITYFKGPIIYFIDGRSSSKHKQRLCIILALPGALMEHLLKGCFKVLVSYLRAWLWSSAPNFFWADF